MAICVEGDARQAEDAIRRQFAGGGGWTAEVRARPAGGLVFFYVRLANVFSHDVQAQLEVLRGVFAGLPAVRAQVFSSAGRRENPNIS